VTGLVYAPGALAAAGRGDAQVWHLHRAALLRGQSPLVLAPVLASAPAPSAALEALLAGCSLVDFPVSAARDVSRLRQWVPGLELVTAAVALAALATRAVVVDDNAARLQPVARRLGVDLRIFVVGAGISQHY
jgi:hypothetical protein